MPNTTAFARRVCLWSSSLAAVIAVPVVATIMTGCSSDSRTVGGRPGSLTAEPELPRVVTRSTPRSATGRVPVVMRQPKPFRVADMARATAEHQVDARGLKWTSYPADKAFPHSIATSTGGRVQLASAEEPGHLETATSDQPVIEIRDMLAGYLRAFNRHDAVAAADHWAPTAENVNLDSGEVTAGREAVHALFTKLFASEPSAMIDVDIASIRPIRDDVALIDGVSRVTYSDDEVIGSRFSAVAVRHEGQWMLESVREAAAAKVAASPKPLDELAWLVGSWENVGPGVIAGSRCDWAPGRNFLVRWQTVQPDDAPASQPRAGDASIPGLLAAAGPSASELMEIIGWDSERQEIRSWIFASNGRFAEATWRRDGEAWEVTVEGRGSDTGRNATCTLFPGGQDALEYRCEGTGLESLMPPACGFHRTSR